MVSCLENALVVSLFLMDEDLSVHLLSVVWIFLCRRSWEKRFDMPVRSRSFRDRSIQRVEPVNTMWGFMRDRTGKSGLNR